MSEDPWATQPPSEKKAFFISPIGEDGTDARRTADQVLKHIVRAGLPASAFIVERADEDKQPGAITPRILSKIINADVVIADLSGFNPNVFYELAVAHGHRKPVVHMQKSDERVAFDVKDMRIVRYMLTDPDKLQAAVADLRAQVDLALKSSEVIETPLTATGKFLALDQSTDPQAEVAERLAAIEAKLESHPALTAGIRTPEDTYAAVVWIEGQIRAGTCSAESIETLKTSATSGWFDSWVDGLLSMYAANANAKSGWQAENDTRDPWTTPASEEPPF